MDPNFLAIKSLYQNEINAHKNQIEELKAKGRQSEEKNFALLQKVRELQDLIEKAHVANKDLHTAFEHVREENLKLQVHNNNQDTPEIQTNNDNELALETAQRQYVNLARESVTWVSDKDRMTQRIKFLERECERYTRDNVTLGKQVRHLLKSLEEERGMIIRRANQIHEVEKPSCASDIIDQHLITFESIEELQQQNQKLLSLVKELAKKEEEKDAQLENEDIRRLNTDIASLRSQLEHVRNDRERIMNAFNNILKQRDLFKILLCKTREVEHMTPEIFQRMVTVACSSVPAIEGTSESTKDKDAHITDLKAMISKLEHELSELRNEFEDVRSKNADESKVKTELLEQAHLKILSESQQAANYKERCELLESNIKLLTAEFEEARTRSQKLVFELEQATQNKKELAETLERERQTRQEELASIFSEIQSMNSKLEYELSELRNELEDARSKNADESKVKTELLEQAHLKILDESQQAANYKERCELLESNIKLLTAELEEVRTRSQKLVFELEQITQNKRELAETLERERQTKQEELAPMLSEIQSKCELRYESQLNSAKAESDMKQNQIAELQRLRNIERTGRLELSRRVVKLSQEVVNSQFKPVKFKTTKRRIKEAPNLSIVEKSIKFDEKSIKIDAKPIEPTQTPNQTLDQPPNQALDQQPNQAPDQQLDSTPEQPLNQGPDQQLGPTLEQPLNQAPDQQLGPTPEQPLNQAPDQQLSLTPEQPPYQAPEQQVDSTPEQPPNLSPEQPPNQTSNQPQLEPEQSRGIVLKRRRNL